MAARLNTGVVVLYLKLVQAGAGAGGRAWLTIGIPTVPRREGADYLTRTLETLLEELPLDAADPLHGRVRVIVMNNSPGAHPVFTRVRASPLLTLPVISRGSARAYHQHKYDDAFRGENAGFVMVFLQCQSWTFLRFSAMLLTFFKHCTEVRQTLYASILVHTHWAPPYTLNPRVLNLMVSAAVPGGEAGRSDGARGRVCGEGGGVLCFCGQPGDAAGPHAGCA